MQERHINVRKFAAKKRNDIRPDLTALINFNQWLQKFNSIVF
jgi:hypothetical protein